MTGIAWQVEWSLKVGVSNFLLSNSVSSLSEVEMPLTKVKDKYQVTIPTAVRKAAGLSVGDVLEAAARGRTVVLRPRTGEDAGAVAKALGFKSVAALRRVVQKEARANAADDRRLAEEWHTIDEEAWQRHGR